MNLKFGGKPLIMIGSLFLTIFIAGFLIWWFVPKATVTIYVAPKQLEDSFILESLEEVKGETLAANVEGDKTKPTTGTKTVGEKAKGQIKVQNGTAFPINLASGTVLTSSTDLKFVMTKTASVSGALSPSTPGTATIDVEASGIGSEYNLNKDEVFKVGNYPKAEVDGIAVDKFSGGTSRQISAVSEEDRKSLLNDLKNELLSDAEAKLGEEIDETKLLVDSSVSEEIIEENYSNKVGDEASNLKLSLSLKISATAIVKSDLSQISKDKLKDRVPSGFVLKDDQITYSFEEMDKEDKLPIKITANLLPSIDSTNIAKQIAGKYPTVAENFLKSIPGFVNAEIRSKPTLRGKLGTLPHVSKNIEVVVTAER